MIYRFQVGETLFQQGKYEEACEEYEQEIALHSDNAEAYNHWGIALDKLGKYEAAIGKYQEAIKHKPDYAKAYNNWGIALGNLKQYEEAIAKYQQATEKKPGLAEAYNNWGIALEILNRPAEAIAKYQQATEKKPDYAEAYFNWGNALRNLKQYEEAIAKYQKATAIKPEYNADAYFSIALTYREQGDYKSGQKYLDDANKAYAAQAKEGQDDQHFFPYGTVLRLLNKLDPASEKYEEGLKINPNNIDILTALVDLYIQKNAHNPGEKSPIYWEKARQYYRQARNLLEHKIQELDNGQSDQLGGATTLLNLGNLHLSMEEYEEAEKNLLEALDLLKALKKDGDSAGVNTSLGILSIRKEDFKKSIDYFKKALQIDPDDLDVRSHLAEAYLKLKQLTQAEREYRKILGITSYHVESHIGLGEVYVEMAEAGEADIYLQAIRHFTKAIEISNNTEGSKQLSPKELAVVYYSRGYARVKLSENSTVSRDGSLLSKALEDFNNCVNHDPEHYKGERAKDKLKKQTSILHQPQKLAETGGMLLLGISSLLVFGITQWFFWKPFFIQAPKSLASQESVKGTKVETNKNEKTLEKNSKNGTSNSKETNVTTVTSNSSPPTQPSNQINTAEYFLLTFGSLTFFLMSSYLPQLLKLKIGGTGIELEKSSIDRITTTQITAASLGISKT